MAIERQKELRRRKQRKRRLKKLKTKLAQTKDLKERGKIVELIKRREPYFEAPQ
ncbi:MAG: hypothetical protein PVF83_00280 [Anaerolineales bacterium]|jgi:hypothetical protein